MSRTLWILTAIALVGLAVPADARCLTDHRPIEGNLTVFRTQTETGRDLKGYQLELPQPTCADVTDLDGAPTRIEAIRTVQILTRNAAEEQKLDSMVGQHITVAGYLDAADPEQHTGDAVLSNAELVLVEGQADGTANAVDDSSADDGGTAIATLDAGGNEMPWQATRAQDPDRAQLESRLVRFVTDFYLSGDNVGPDVLRAIYAPRVNYFGKRNTGLDAIVKDKLGYYSRWPVREFALKPHTLEVRPISIDGQVYELTFVYDFNVASASKRSAGTGYARLQIDLSDGHGKIVRESGKVIARN
mgnify:CR=1 FL=1